MVRIVDLKPSATVVKRQVCPNCGVTLEYVPRDVQIRTDADLDSSSWLECPGCRYQIHLRSR